MLESPFIAALIAALPARDWLAPTTDELRVAVVLSAATLLYLVYHLAISRLFVTRLFRARTTNDADLRTTTSFFRKAVGAFLFGLVPAVALGLAWPGGLAACGFSFTDAPRSLLYALGFIALMVPLIASQARKPSFRQHYPEVRRPFTRRVATWNALAWVAYLVGYEFFFRGVLVIALAPLVGPLPALTLSLMAYVFVQLDRYAGETLGTLFTGSLFGVVALVTGSILMPVVAHVGVALLTDHLAGHFAARAGDPADG